MVVSIVRHLRPRRGRKRLALGVLLVLLAAWAAGLVAFVGRIPDRVADPGRLTDAIVVLTGGSRRVETGLRLLTDGLGRRLFLSGVYPETTLADLARRFPAHAHAIACCVEAGHEAVDTTGNAAESAAWIRRRGVRSLRLVTAAYHMPRSLLEFRRALPETDIVPHPVFPSRVDTDGWWRRPRTALLIAGEYAKYLVASVRHHLGGPLDGR